jgi:hypothetical protein
MLWKGSVGVESKDVGVFYSGSAEPIATSPHVKFYPDPDSLFPFPTTCSAPPSTPVVFLHHYHFIHCQCRSNISHLNPPSLPHSVARAVFSASVPYLTRLPSITSSSSELLRSFPPSSPYCTVQYSTVVLVLPMPSPS